MPILAAPTTATALAISKGWTKLVGPIMVIGTVGYVIGNYVGTIVYFIVTQMSMKAVKVIKSGL